MKMGMVKGNQMHRLFVNAKVDDTGDEIEERERIQRGHRATYIPLGLIMATFSRADSPRDSTYPTLS